MRKQGIDRLAHQFLTWYFNLMVDVKLECNNSIFEMVELPSSYLTLTLPNCIQNTIRICDPNKCRVTFQYVEVEHWTKINNILVLI